MDPIVRKIRDECRASGLRISIEDDKVVCANGVPCSGYFQSAPLELKVAFKAPNFKSILIHEYCHFKQWKERSLEWVTAESGYGVDSSVAIDAWLTKLVELDPVVLNSHIEAVMSLELDCEKRALEFMLQNDLKDLAVDYAKQANAYVLSYRMVQELRQWNSAGEAPYNEPAILALMPTEFISIDFKMSHEMKSAFLKCYSKRG